MRPLRRSLKVRGPDASKAKGKGKGKHGRQQSEDGFDDYVAMPETLMPHVRSRYHVAETPVEGIVALLFLVLV